MDKVVIKDCTLYHGDARELLEATPTLCYDAVVTDPAYGVDAMSGNKSRSNHAAAVDYGDLTWDKEPCPQDLIEHCRRVSNHQIIFGGNYFTLPPTPCWLVWDKLNGSNSFADCELAWTNLTKAVRRLQFRWQGYLRDSHEPRVHPTQKPVPVMEWCLRHLPAGCKTILDPFAGSFTTGVACAHLGFSFVGCERERQYFDAGCKRIEEAYGKGSMFDELVEVDLFQGVL